MLNLATTGYKGYTWYNIQGLGIDFFLNSRMNSMYYLELISWITGFSYVSITYFMNMAKYFYKKNGNGKFMLKSGK